MPKVTVYRPNRTKKQFFTACAVARIAWNCYDDTQTPKDDIMRCVAKRLGYRTIALPTADRDLPEAAQNIVERVKRVITLITEFAELVGDWIEAFGSGLDWILSIFPSFITDDENTIEDKFLRRAFKSRRARAFLAAIKLVDKVRDKVKEVQLDLSELLANLEKVQGMIQFGEQAVDLEIYETSGGGNCQCKTPYVELIFVPYGEFTVVFKYEERILPKRQGVEYSLGYDDIFEGSRSRGNGRIAARAAELLHSAYPSVEAFEEDVRRETSFDSSGIQNHPSGGWFPDAPLSIVWRA